MSNKIAASGPDQSPIQIFVHGPGHQQVYEAGRLRNTELPVQATAARLEQELVQVPVKAAVHGPEMQQVHVAEFDNPGTKNNHAM